MKLLNVQQIRDWDAWTIQKEPVTPAGLMERAGKACTEYLLTRFSREYSFVIYCGQGNNGGDGLVIARHLSGYGYRVTVLIVRHSARVSDEFSLNLERVRKIPGVILREISTAEDLPGGGATLPGGETALPDGETALPAGSVAPTAMEMSPAAWGAVAGEAVAGGAIARKRTVIVDALLGSGTKKPLDGLLATVAGYINNSGSTVVSIDVPTGLPGDAEQWDAVRYRYVVSADTTLTFQVPKTSFLFPDSGRFCGDLRILNIGLHEEFPGQVSTELEYVDEDFVAPLIRPRRKFAHKGDFGHALLVAGSRGKNGAAVLAAKACLRAGTGLLTVGIPQQSYFILQTAVPEAMVVLDNSDDYPVFRFGPGRYTAVGVGAGIGTEPKTQEGYRRFLQELRTPVVIDADGINLLAAILDKESDFPIPDQAVLTPHVKEFGRLAGESATARERFGLLREFAIRKQVHVILKGAHSCLAAPDGRCYFNSTGNPAMAKGGSGDVLTGMITGLLAQGYPQRDAAILGMYFHGKAGDTAARKRSPGAVIASDMIEEINISGPRK